MTRSGGGITLRHVSNVKAGKAEPVPHVVQPERAAQIGMSTHFAKGPLQEGRGYSTPQGPTDNTKDLRPGGCGRQILPSGTQAKTPSVSPPTKSRPHW